MISLKYKIAPLFFAICLVPMFVSAHQPRIVESRSTTVVDPEISKAYYGKLTGVKDVYFINSSSTFNLYVNILVPDISGQKKDVSAVIYKDGKEAVVLNGINFEWKKFFEPFGNDSYWKGPEYKIRAEAGNYEIRVSSVGGDSKYSLAVGETESFDLKEGINALEVIPKLKRDFFNESPANFIFSLFGYGKVIIIFVFAAIFGIVSRSILKRIRRDKTHGAYKNIGAYDRLLRLVAGAVLLLFAINTTWNPIIIFFSDFLFFEALFGWCAIYAITGKNTCKV